MIMKTVQKLEILGGLATLVVSSLFYYRIVLSYINDDRGEQYYTPILVRVFLGILAPALLIAVGSLIHALARNRFGFILTLLGSFVLILFYGMMLLSRASFYYFGWIFGFVAVSPGVLAVLTVFFAFRSRKLSEVPNN